MLTVRKGKLEENNIIDPSESEYQQVIKAIARALESVETLDAVADSEHNVRLGRVQSLLRRGARRLFS